MKGNIIVLLILFHPFHGSWYDMCIALRMLFGYVWEELKNPAKLLVSLISLKIKTEFSFNILKDSKVYIHFFIFILLFKNF